MIATWIALGAIADLAFGILIGKVISRGQNPPLDTSSETTPIYDATVDWLDFDPSTTPFTQPHEAHVKQTLTLSRDEIPPAALARIRMAVAEDELARRSRGGV